MWAVEAYVGHWDGYKRSANNYYLHSDADGRFSMLPWGTDQTFDFAFPFLESYGRGVLAQRCVADASCRSQYVAALVRTRGAIDDLETPERSVTLYQTLRPLILADPRREQSMEAADASAARVASFLQQRSSEVDALPESVATEMAQEGGPGPGCGLDILTSFDPAPIKWD